MRKGRGERSGYQIGNSRQIGRTKVDGFFGSRNVIVRGVWSTYGFGGIGRGTQNAYVICESPV